MSGSGCVVDIIIPTFNNAQYLNQTLKSLIDARMGENLYHIYVVNNGHPEACDWIEKGHKFITVLQTGGENLGWEGGLKVGLEASKSEFVMFLNDDIIVPYAQKFWMNKMLQHFRDPNVAAVGPCSNMVMGMQNMLSFTDTDVFTSTFLIGFCMLLRRSAIDEVGGVDDTLPGGDDLDLSIRLKDKDYRLVVDKNIFIFHYGSITGQKVYGTYEQAGGWNSPLFTEKTNFALIKKHGFRKWYDCIIGAFKMPSIEYSFKKDTEGDLIREKVKTEGLKVVDIGCGNLKTFPDSTGVDIIPKGEKVVQIGGDSLSVADISADVSQPLPFEDGSFDVAVARHILEHMIDPITAIRNWQKIIKKGGKLVISIPNEYLINTIPMNPQHVHAWTPDTFPTFIEAVGGLKILDIWDSENSISFTTVLEKI